MSRRSWVAAAALGLVLARPAFAQPAIDEPLEYEPLIWPGAAGEVRGLYSLPSQLIVIGAFEKIGDRAVRSPAAWDGTTWSAIPEPPSGGALFSSCVFEDRLLYARGYHSDTLRIDAWDGLHWQPSAIPFPEVEPESLAAFTLTSGGSTLLASSLLGREHPYHSRLDRWRGTEWEPVPIPSTAWTISEVKVAPNGGILIFGRFDSTGTAVYRSAELRDGAWSTAAVEKTPASTVYWRDRWLGAWPSFSGGTATTRLEVLEPEGWMPFAKPVDGRIGSMIVLGDRLVLVSAGDLFGGSTKLLQVTADSLIQRGDIRENGHGGTIEAGCAWRGDLYLGGSFTSIDEVGAFNLARFAGDHVVPFVPGNAPNRSPEKLVPFGNGLAAFGDFDTAGNQRAEGIGLFDGSTWTLLPSRPAVRINDLQEFRGQLVAAGFGTGETRSISTVAYDGSEWQPLGESLQFGQIYDLELYQGELIAVGSFLRSGDTFTDRAAAWDGSSWRGLGIGVRGEANSAESWNGELIVAGNLSAAGNHDVSGIAAWDGYDWSPLGAGIPRSRDLFEPAVLDLAIYGDQLIAAGNFERAGEVESRGIALWDGVAWRPFAQGKPEAIQPRSISFLLPMANELWASGIFVIGRHELWSQLCRWDGEEWHRIPDGAYLTAAVRLADGRTYLSGGFRPDTGATERLVLWAGQTVSPRVGMPSLRLDALGPNPTRGSLDLRFHLARAMPVHYSLHDVTGRRMVSIDSGRQSAGPHSIHIDAESLSLPLLLSGVYFLRLEAGNDVVNQRIVVVR